LNNVITNDLESAVLNAAIFGGGEPVTHTIPEDAHVTVTDASDDMLADLVITSWTRD
jgi:hypothetical protein